MTFYGTSSNVSSGRHRTLSVATGASLLLLVSAGAVPGCSGSPTAADQAAPPSSPRNVTPQAPWKPADPEPKTFDWIRLKSGEWLKGEITVLRRGSLEFDSEELDELNLDWEDVVELRSPRVNMVVIDDRTIILGKVAVIDDVVVLREDKEGAEERRLARDRLRSIVPGTPEEINYWSGDLSVGVTFRRGNTDQTEMTTIASIRRRTPLTRLELGYTGNFGTLDDTENTNNHRVSTTLDVFLTRRFFLRPLSFEYFRDRFQNIENRFTPGAGVGYDIFNREKLSWTILGGGGYQYTRFISVSPGDDIERGIAVALFGTSFEQDLTDDVEISFQYDTQVSLSDVEETSHHALAKLSVELTRRLDLDVSFLWDRIGRSVSNSSGDDPEPDDFRLIVGFGVEF